MHSSYGAGFSGRIFEILDSFGLSLNNSYIELGFSRTTAAKTTVDLLWPKNSISWILLLSRVNEQTSH